MNMKKITVIYFSPTGTTRKISEAVCSAFITKADVAGVDTACASVDASAVQRVDLTTDRGLTLPSFGANDLLILGLPVYGGRIPYPVDSILKTLKGSSTPCVPLVVYGNRAYEDALLELSELLSRQGFVAVGAGAFIGEHSYGNDIAGGRPDRSDLEKAAAFGAQVRLKLDSAADAAALSDLALPGNHPYKERSASDVIWAPETLETCTSCGLCVNQCPVGIIDPERPDQITDPKSCLHCCACVKLCPFGAKVITAAPYQMFRAYLTANCSVQKQPEIFL